MKNKCCIIFIILFFEILSVTSQDAVLLPIDNNNRKSIANIKLTEIGDFGRIRKARAGIPEHFHTGIDIKRPSQNYIDEPIFPIAEGIVISLRNDGPYAQIIVEHPNVNDQFLWSVYEHIAGIKVNIGEEVSPSKPIGRFMNKSELNKYGGHFDHLHLEIMKIAPFPIQPPENQAQLVFKSYGLICYTEAELLERYYHPIEFFKSNFNE